MTTPKWTPNWGPQPPQAPVPAKKSRKGLLITGGVVALFVIGAVSVASQPRSQQAITPALTSAAVVRTTSAAPIPTPTTPTPTATTSTPAPAPSTTKAPPPPPAPKTTAPALSVSQKQAMLSAESYLDTMAFSRKGLIHQLEFEGFSTEDATYAVDHVTVDWTKQADLSAESYMQMGGFSHKSLLNQLLYEGFTQEQAEHGVKSVGL